MTVEVFIISGLPELNQSLSRFTLYTCIISSKQIIQSEKYKSRFHSERPFNGESESENAVHKGENLIQFD